MCVYSIVLYCTVSKQVLSPRTSLGLIFYRKAVLWSVKFTSGIFKAQTTTPKGQGCFLYIAMKTANICCLEPAVLCIIRRAHNHNNHFLANLLWRDSLFKR